MKYALADWLLLAALLLLLMLAINPRLALPNPDAWRNLAMQP